MSTYIFRQAGSIPGIAGLFANCRVDVDAAGNVTETPLLHHPAEGVEVTPIEEAPPAQETIVQEQAAPTPAPQQFIGG